MRGLCLSCGAFVDSKDYSEDDIQKDGLIECRCCSQKVLICWQSQEREQNNMDPYSSTYERLDKTCREWMRKCDNLEADNARLRQHNEQLVEFLLSICNTLAAWKNEEFKTKSEVEKPPIRANFPPFDHRNLGKRGEE